MIPEKKYYRKEWDAYTYINDDNEERTDHQAMYLALTFDKLLELNEELRSRFHALDTDEGKYYKGKRKAYGELLSMFKKELFPLMEEYDKKLKKEQEKEDEKYGL